MVCFLLKSTPLPTESTGAGFRALPVTPVVSGLHQIIPSQKKSSALKKAHSTFWASPPQKSGPWNLLERKK